MVPLAKYIPRDNIGQEIIYKDFVHLEQKTVSGEIRLKWKQ